MEIGGALLTFRNSIVAFHKRVDDALCSLGKVNGEFALVNGHNGAFSKLVVPNDVTNL